MAYHGFPKISESEYDSFDTGHSSTSISVALGMARANALENKNNHVIAVIGDGSLTGGMAMEALNDAGSSNSNITVILNDNEMSISKNVGGVPALLTKIRIKKTYKRSNNCIKRFFNKNISDDMYLFFIEEVLKNFKAEDNKVLIVLDHTTCEDRFVILSFMLSIGKRGIPIYYKVYDYKDPNNKSMKDVKEGLEKVRKLLEPYKYEVTVLADRGFGSTELFEYIDKIGWKYFIRVKGNYNVYIPEDEVIGKLEDIEHPRGFTRFFYNIELTQNRYRCNIATKESKESKEDSWYIATNGEPKKAINNYKRRFTIEEMFKDMKSNGLGMEETWTKKLSYFKNIMLCISIAYVYIITIGSECARNGRNKEIGTFVKTKRANKTRIYSVFQIGVKWLKRCYFSKVNRRLMCEFILFDL